MDTFNTAAQGVGSAAAAAAHTVQASTPATGSGTPLMTLASYLLYVEGALILLMSVPVYVPYRKQVLEWVRFSPRLWTVRVVIICVHAFVGILLVDTYLRLNRITRQIDNHNAAHAMAAAHPAGIAMNMGATTAGMGSAGLSNVDATTGRAQSVNDLFSSRFRAQRDFYILAFTLFCSTVLSQLHMLLIKMDRYRQQRNEARGITRKSSAAPSPPRVAEKASRTRPATISSSPDPVKVKLAPEVSAPASLPLKKTPAEVASVGPISNSQDALLVNSATDGAIAA